MTKRSETESGRCPSNLLRVSRRDFLEFSAASLLLGSTMGYTAPSYAETGNARQLNDFIDAVPRYIQALLSNILTPEQLRKTYLTISNPKAHGSIGPRLDDHPDLTRKPALTVTLPLNQAAGNGSLHKPWRGAIAAYLAGFNAPDEPKTFEVPQWSALNLKDVDVYLATLPYRPVTITLPPGHYIEDAITLPPGIWLVADRNAHLHIVPVDERAEASSPFVHMRTCSGLLGLELNGSNIRDFVPEPPHRINAIVTQHGCEIHSSYVHHWPGSGIRAHGTRSRESNWCRMTNNIIEYVGYSGARLGSKATFKNNQIRYCGILRPNGGGGDDGVVAAYSLDVVIANNLAIGRRAPHGRHIISGHRPRATKVLGNISIAEGPMRNNVGFSDGSHLNEFIGNVLLGLGRGGGIQAGISNSGYGSIMTYNATIGNTRAFRNKARCPTGDEDFRMTEIIHNYAEFQKSGIHRSTCYTEKHNDIRKLSGYLPVAVNYEDYGFFTWA